MKPAALAFTLLILLAYFVLVYIDPHHGLLYPRGGILTLGISLALANAAIAVGGNPHRPLAKRFELAAAGWIWLLVQPVCIGYLILQAWPA